MHVRDHVSHTNSEAHPHPLINTTHWPPRTSSHLLSPKSCACQTRKTHHGGDVVRGAHDGGMAVAEVESLSQFRGAAVLTSPATEHRAPNAQPSYTVPSWRISFAPRRAPGPVPTAGIAFFSCGECMTRMCQASLARVWGSGTHRK